MQTAAIRRKPAMLPADIGVVEAGRGGWAYGFINQANLD
jgi:hypothetical protein